MNLNEYVKTYNGQILKIVELNKNEDDEIISCKVIEPSTNLVYPYSYKSLKEC